MYFLTVNAGSSSIKFSLFRDDDSLYRDYDGSIEGIGFETATFQISGPSETDDVSQSLVAADHKTALKAFLDWVEQTVTRDSIRAVGHRVVHGGPLYSDSCFITNEVVEKLRDIAIFDPEHLPAEIELIEELQQAFPGVPQIACFDTAFHHNLPTVAKQLPIPRRYLEQGIRRYGFHGLSYRYLLDELGRVAGENVANGRIIMAHLGNGVSLAAVHEHQPIDTSMALTPAAGVPMSTRSGDLDPGLVSYLAKSEGMDAERFNKMIGFESGLLGISETTPDMKKLLELEAEDSRAAEAVSIFCYHLKKYIGAYAAALGGLDTLVFSGGMGEKAPVIRARVCEGLDFLGIQLDSQRNEANETVISTQDSPVSVRVMHTDEALSIVRDMARLVTG